MYTLVQQFASFFRSTICEKIEGNTGIRNKQELNEQAILVVLLNRCSIHTERSVLEMKYIPQCNIIHLHLTLRIDNSQHFLDLLDIESRIDHHELSVAFSFCALEKRRQLSQNTNQVDLEHGQREISGINH